MPRRAPGSRPPRSRAAAPPAPNGRFGRLKRRSPVAACAACSTPRPDVKPAELERLGWVDNGEASVCPDCVQVGWQLAEGSSEPFRRLSDKP